MHLAALILSVAAVVLATVSQGTVNLSRDFLIAYDPAIYSTTAQFCGTFRLQCIYYAGALDYHHSLDCVFDQPLLLTPDQSGVEVRAFCGGVKKLPDGSNPGRGATIVPFTAGMIARVKGAVIVGNPVSDASPSTPPRTTTVTMTETAAPPPAPSAAAVTSLATVPTTPAQPAATAPVQSVLDAPWTAENKPHVHRNHHHHDGLVPAAAQDVVKSLPSRGSRMSRGDAVQREHKKVPNYIATPPRN